MENILEEFQLKSFQRIPGAISLSEQNIQLFICNLSKLLKVMMIF